MAADYGRRETASAAPHCKLVVSTGFGDEYGRSPTATAALDPGPMPGTAHPRNPADSRRGSNASVGRCPISEHLHAVVAVPGPGDADARTRRWDFSCPAVTFRIWPETCVASPVCDARGHRASGGPGTGWREPRKSISARSVVTAQIKVTSGSSRRRLTRTKKRAPWRRAGGGHFACRRARAVGLAALVTIAHTSPISDPWPDSSLS